MTQKFIVNGVSYDSLEAMPPEVRQQYDRAMEMLKDVGRKDVGTKTVTNVPGGVKINVEKRSVRYNIDGKTYDDIAQVPPEIRAKVDQAMAAAPQRRDDIRVIEAHVKINRSSGGGRLLVWLLIAAVIVVLISLL